MSNNMTITTGDVFIPEIWSKETIEEVRSKLVLANLVWRFDKECKMGDTIHVPSITNLIANDKLKNLPVQFQSPTETNLDITINKHKESSFQIEDMLATQAARDLRAPYTDAAGYAIGKAIDTDIATLGAALAQTKGTYNTAITTDVILDSIELLDLGDVPEEDRHFAFRPDVKRDLLDLSNYVSADYVDGRPVTTGKVGALYGVATHMTTNLIKAAGTNTNNILFHKQAFAAAVQKNMRVQSEYSVKDLANLVVADCIYGVKTTRPAFGVLIKT